MSGLSWTIPTRSSGSRTLSTIPAEIYHEIFEYLKQPDDPELPPKTRDFRNLSLVCRYFCAVMIPRIFEVVFIDGKATNNNTGHSFCRRICNGDKTALTAASHARVFRIRELSPVQGWSAELVSLYAAALLQMRKLEEIDLRGTIITNGLLKSLTSCPNLKRLQLHSCLAQKLHKRLLEQLSQVTLDRLDVTMLTSYRPIGDQDLLELQTFAEVFAMHLPVNNVTSLASDCSYLEKGILAMPPLLNLQEFLTSSSIGSFGVADPFKVLTKMPNLKSLVIRLLDTEANGTLLGLQQLPELQHLGELSAPMKVLEQLVPGRNITSIGITFQTREWTVFPHISPPSGAKLKQLASSSRQPITKVQAPFCFYIETQFSNLFPSLRHLTLQPFHPNYVDSERDNYDDWRQRGIDKPMTRFLNSWPAHPPLYELTIDLCFISRRGPGGSAREPFWMHGLSEAIPTIRFCTILRSNPKVAETWCYSAETKHWMRTVG